MADIDRHELHTLVDHIPESDVPVARKVLRALADPVELAILAAPVDDEAETDEERASVASSLADASPDIPFERMRQANTICTAAGIGDAVMGWTNKGRWYRSGGAGVAGKPSN